MTTWQLFTQRIRRCISPRTVPCIVSGAAILVLLGGYTMVLHDFLNAAIEFGYDSLPLNLAILVSLFFSFAGGVLLILSSAQVGEPTVIHSRQNFRANALFVWLGTTIITGLFLLPATILYAIQTRSSHVLWLLIRMLYVTAVFSIFPLCAAALVALILVPLLRKSPRLMTTIGRLFLLFLAAIGLGYLLTGMITATDAGGFFAAVLERHWTSLNAWSFPPISWASFGIHAGGLTSWLALASLTLTALIAAVFACLFGFGINRILASRSRKSASQSEKE